MKDIEAWFLGVLEKTNWVSEKARPYYLRWLVEYLGFCRKEALDSRATDSFERFLRVLPGNIKGFQYGQLLKSVELYWKELPSSNPREGAAGGNAPGPQSGLVSNDWSLVFTKGL